MAIVDPSMAVNGSEWAVKGLGASESPSAADVTGAGGAGTDKGFADMLSNAVTQLQDSQVEAARQSQALATGTAQNPEAVVLAVEHARLQMELASAVRTKVTDAINEVMRTQI